MLSGIKDKKKYHMFNNSNYSMLSGINDDYRYAYFSVQKRVCYFASSWLRNLSCLT